jgi:ATP phosphoribosyltransferase
MSGDAREIGSLDNLSLEGPGIASDAVEAIRLALPKGRMQEGVLKLLSDAGIDVRLGAREYRPSINLPNYDVKMLKPQNILEMLDIGSRDLGFAGHDWVLNLGVDVIELLDTQMDPVRIVVAGRSPEIFEEAIKGTRQVIIASEYEKLTKDWIQRRGVNARFVRAYGATESFPPEDADLIVDNAATGSTLKANGLIVFDEVMRSSTRLFCSREAFNNPEKRKRRMYRGSF